MALGHGGRFLAQLSFCLRQRLTIPEALDLLAGEVTVPGWADGLRRVRARVNAGETLGKSLAELPAPFPAEILPLVEGMESQGTLLDDLEPLSAWPDAATADPAARLARIFIHASILLRNGQPIPDALRHATASDDPEPLKTAVRAISKASILDQPLSEVMSDHPGVFSPALRRVVLQMERNGDAAATFRDLGLALAKGWFSPPGPPKA